MGRAQGRQRKNTYVVHAEQPQQQVLSDIRMAWHKDQQSLILNEMIVARRKLEEENEKLREDLHDAKKTVKSLSIYLDEVLSGESTPASKATTKSQKWRILGWASKPHARKRQGARKETFKNPMLGGKKLFSKGNENRREKPANWPKEVVLVNPHQAREQVKPVVRSRRHKESAASERAAPSKRAEAPSRDMAPERS